MECCALSSPAPIWRSISVLPSWLSQQQGLQTRWYPGQFDSGKAIRLQTSRQSIRRPLGRLSMQGGPSKADWAFCDRQLWTVPFPAREVCGGHLEPGRGPSVQRAGVKLCSMINAATLSTNFGFPFVCPLVFLDSVRSSLVLPIRTESQGDYRFLHVPLAPWKTRRQ